MRPTLLTHWIVAALLTVSVPLCCCQSQQLLSLLWGGGATHAVVGGEESHSAKSSGHASHGERADSSVSGHRSQEGVRHAAPCDNGPGDSDSDCNCGNIYLLVGAATGLSAPTLLASSHLLLVSEGIAPVDPAPRFFTLSSVAATLIPRPPTSLLRLHCALLV